MFRLITALFSLVFSAALAAQMPQADGTVRYGNEWIDYGTPYLRVAVTEDGMYRVSPAQLAAAGLSSPDGTWRVYHYGAEVPVEVGTDGSVLFYGQRNDGALDGYLYEDPDAMQLNTRYSMHTDTTVYFVRAGAGAAYSPAAPSGEPVSRNHVTRHAARVFSDETAKQYLRSSGVSIYYSHYDVGEGFGQRSNNDLLSSNGSTESVVDLALPNATGAGAQLSWRFGTGFGPHNVTISADGTPLTNATASGWAVRQGTATFSPAGETTTVGFAGTAGPQDKPNLAWVDVAYPASPTYTAGDGRFTVRASAAPVRVRFTGLGADAGAGQVVKSYAPATGRVVSAPVDAAGTATFVFPASADDVTYELVATEADLRTGATRPVTFGATLPAATNVDYLLLTSRKLRGPNVAEMADYRRSPAGGGYRVHVADVEDLYDEFSYGVANHPLALRNYLALFRDQAPGLQYLFLVGKGREYRELRTPADREAAEPTYFIPSFGLPASDNLLTAELGGVVPALSTGRLSCVNDAEVGIYLRKLRDVEEQINRGDQDIAGREWMKQVMHLGGGGDPGEQSQIRSRLTNMTEIIEASDMAANVVPFYKTSSAPVEESRQQAIFDRINGGTAILTFMGHSTNQTFDFSIDDESNYANAGRYPFMVSLGCYSGDAFTAERSISERFIFWQEKGAVAFAASKGLGYISALGLYGREMYHQIGTEEYGNGIGDAIRKTNQRYRDNSQFTMRILLEQFSLSGDPAYRLHPRPGTDLVVDPASVSFTPEVVPAQDPTFDVSFRLVNLGLKPTADSVALRFRQQLPGGTVQELGVFRYAAPTYDAELTQTLPSLGFPAVGQNRILITVDADDEITELPAPAAETNNELTSGGTPGVALTFVANTARAAFPPPYATVGGPLELIASTTNPLAPALDYVLQVATDKDFAQLVANERLNRPGGVIRYPVPFAPADSTTYYWRISPDSVFTQGAGYVWSESSLTWLADRPTAAVGFATQHPGQTIDGEFENIRATPESEDWNFTQTVTDITISNARYRDNNFPAFLWNGQLFRTQFPWHTRSGLQVTVIDSTNNTRWLYNPGGGTYGTTPSSRGDVFSFDTRTQPGRAALIDFIRNEIEPGKYVTLYSAQRSSQGTQYVNDGWLTDSVDLGTTIYDVLEEQGALEVRQLSNVGSVPYIYVFQKDMGPIGEAVALTPNDTISVLATIRQNWDQGRWLGPVAGPAERWDDVDLRFRATDVSATDSCRLVIYGGATAGNVTDELRTEGLSIRAQRGFSFDLSGISTAQYPYLRAELYFYDVEERSAPDLQHLYFDYQATGDVAVSPSVALTLPDSVQQGEAYRLEVGYENIARAPFDSLLVELVVKTATNDVLTRRVRQAPLPAGGTDRVAFDVATEDLTGDFSLTVRLNPDRAQPENVVFNNDFAYRARVGRDELDPTLQVFFDGVRINEGDLVSSRPEIRVQLRDENRNLLLNDTAAFQLHLRYPDGREERFAFTDDRVEFVPAATADNVAEIYLRPDLPLDGEYELRVAGRDRSGNASGRLDWRQRFQVINQQMISNVLAYPNPFTTQTRFVYTLTGNEPPEMFRIQIMTVSGRVVRDIDVLAQEEVKIGTHRTNLTWDGTDEYGDLLANGVYLYRIITNDGTGQQLDKYDNGTDQFFKQGLGKVVILR